MSNQEHDEIMSTTTKRAFVKAQDVYQWIDVYKVYGEAAVKIDTQFVRAADLAAVRPEVFGDAVLLHATQRNGLEFYFQFCQE